MLIGEHIKTDENKEANCAECGEKLGPINENIKKSLVVQEKPIEEAGPHYVSPEPFVEKSVVFREYYCPGCGTILFTETAKPDDDPLSEIELDPDSI